MFFRRVLTWIVFVAFITFVLLIFVTPIFPIFSWALPLTTGMDRTLFSSSLYC